MQTTFYYIKEQIELLGNSVNLITTAFHNGDTSMYLEFSANGKRQLKFCKGLLSQHEEELTHDEHEYLTQLYERNEKRINDTVNNIKVLN